MEIQTHHLGKKFIREWIFRNLTYDFKSGACYAIKGANGSGKSTLLQLIAGVMPATDGTISYAIAEKVIAPEDVFRMLALATPYQHLIEELSLEELYQFHFSFKKPLLSNASEFADRLGLGKAIGKPIEHYSSGMKQRVKLGLALFSDVPLLLLDEPTSNLDAQGIDWYLSEMNNLLHQKTILICSNQPNEYSFCDEQFEIAQWK